MRRYLILVSAMAFVAGTLAPTVAISAGQYSKGDGNVGNGKTIYEQGKGDVPACNSCHGVDGTGDDNMGTPRLVGQGFTFLLKQLEDYATDKREDTTMFVMNANAKGMSPQDRRDVATYLSQKQVDFKGSNLKELAANGVATGKTNYGKSLVEIGSPELSACKSCHGYAGRGAPPIYPVILNQRYTYLVSQLKKFRDGSRANDVMGQMRAIARKMSDDDINNAAAYLTGAERSTPGNIHTPYTLH